MYKIHGFYSFNNLTITVDSIHLAMNIRYQAILSPSHIRLSLYNCTLSPVINTKVTRYRVTLYLNVDSDSTRPSGNPHPLIFRIILYAPQP